MIANQRGKKVAEEGQQVFTTSQVGRMFGVTAWTVRYWIRHHTIEAGYFNGRWRITQEVVDDMKIRQRLLKSPIEDRHYHLNGSLPRKETPENVSPTEPH